MNGVANSIIYWWHVHCTIPIYARSSRLLATIVGVGRSHSLVLNSPFFIISSTFYLDNLRYGVIFLLLDSCTIGRAKRIGWRDTLSRCWITIYCCHRRDTAQLNIANIRWRYIYWHDKTYFNSQQLALYILFYFNSPSCIRFLSLFFSSKIYSCAGKYIFIYPNKW